MKPKIMPVAIGVGVVAFVVVILGLPWATQSDQARANAEADLHTATALRALAKYQANVAQIAVLRAQLDRQLDAGGPTSAPQDGAAQEAVRSKLKEFQELSQAFRGRARKGPAAKLEERLRRLVPDATAIPEMPKLDLGQSEASITRGVEGALKRVDKLTTENARLLEQAWKEAGAALRVQYGQAETRGHVNANHLSAYVLYVQGDVKRHEALANRIEAHRTRLRAWRLVDQSQGLLDQMQATASRMPKQRTEHLRREKEELEKRLSQVKQRMTDLSARVEAKRKQIAEAKARAQAARKALAALEATGYDPKKPADVKRYVDEYTQQAGAERKASIEAAALKTGTLEGARLDDAHGGDLLKDRYVASADGKGIRVVKGLDTLVQERARAEKGVADIEGLLAGNAARVEQTQALASRLEADHEALGERKANLDKQINLLLVEADQRAAVADKIESDALQKLAQAEKAYGKAARSARNRGGELASGPSMEDLPKDKDTEAAMAISQADVAHARALVHLQRLRGLRAQVQIINAAAAAEVAGIDRAGAQKLEEELAKVQDESVKAIDVSIELLGQRAAKAIHKNARWIPQVSVASAYQLRSVLTAGADAADALQEAIALYDEAVEGREASPFLKPYVRVADHLRATSRPAPTTKSKPAPPKSKAAPPKAKPETAPPKAEKKAAAEKGKAEKPKAFVMEITGAGRPMILIPGLSSGGNVWAGAVEHFRDRYECHVVTLAGFAGQPAIKGEPFLERVRDGLIQYIRDKKLERPVILGHSVGGFMAFWLGATAPEKLGPIIAVDGVPYYPALMNPSATPKSVQQQAEAMRNMYKMQTPEQFARHNREFLSMMITNPKDLEKVAQLSNKSDPRAVGQAFYEIMTIDLREKVKRIQTPILLLGAIAHVQDPDLKKRAEQNYRSQVATIPRHTVVFAPKARHFIQLDEPEFFIRQVESFLKNADAMKEQ